MKTYTIQDKECGNPIDDFNSLEEAQDALKDYEQQDKEDGIYTPNFYEIILTTNS